MSMHVFKGSEECVKLTFLLRSLLIMWVMYKKWSNGKCYKIENTSCMPKEPRQTMQT